MNRQNEPTGITRREMIKAVGTAALATGAALASEPATRPKAGTGTTAALREKARKNLKLGIFSSVYAELPVEQAAARIKEHGFDRVVLDPSFADVKFDFAAPDWKEVKKITSALGRHGIEVVCLSGYHNVIEPDPAKRKQNDQRIGLLMADWKRFGSPMISTETGTYNRENQFMDSPENYTEKAYLECRAAFEKLARQAEKHAAVIAIEPYWRNVIDSAERAQRLFKEVKSPALKLVMDPCNYFRKEDLPRMRPMLEDIFKRVGGQTVIAHAKDVKASADRGTDLPAAGLGVLDYPLFLRLLAGLDREMSLVIEHVKLEDVPRARDFVKSQFDRI
jgi:sugar phosphate isomerase/epimerase